MIRTRRRWKSTALSVLAATVCAASLGCAFGEFRPDDPLNRQYSLERVQREYSYQIRWSNFKKAAQFVEPKQRAAFMDWGPDPKKFRFTDYLIGDLVVEDEEKRHSTVEVTYTLYSLFALVEYEIHETQVWTRKGRGNYWFVETSFVEMPEDEPDATEGDADAAASTAMN